MKNDKISSNFGVLPLMIFVDPADYAGIEDGDTLRLQGIRHALSEGNVTIENVTRQRKFQVCHSLSPRQVRLLLRGGLTNWMKERLSDSAALRSV